MGCCCSKRNLQKSIELQTAMNSMNEAVTCKCGIAGENVNIHRNSSNNSYTLQSLQGSSIAIGSCSLECDTAMWEVRVGKHPENVSIGVKRWNKKNSIKDLNGDLNDDTVNDNISAWILKGVTLKENDIVGIYWDQTDLPMLTFSLNGEPLLDAAIIRIRPSNDVYPAVSVANGASCDFIFDGKYFSFPPKSSKFKMIVCATSLI
jgi:hypothetical protein